MDEVLGEEAPPEEPEADPEPKERSAILMELIVWLRSALISDWPNLLDLIFSRILGYRAPPRRKKMRPACLKKTGLSGTSPTVCGRVESESFIQQNAAKTVVNCTMDEKTVPKACKIRVSLPNLTLTVNNTVKKEELTWKT
jgi:hypothetical protein